MMQKTESPHTSPRSELTRMANTFRPRIRQMQHSISSEYSTVCIPAAKKA